MHIRSIRRPRRALAAARATALTLCAGAALACAAPAWALTAGELASRYAAGRPASAARGQAFFTSRHGQEWSCASCHGDVPVTPGRHASTGKAIEPMAPAINARRFTDEAKVEKWFRRNCKDVVGRECTAAEKADVITWLVTLR
jgi:hypothetical protein